MDNEVTETKNVLLENKMKIVRMKLYFVLLMKSHLQSYPCPLQINSFWNLVHLRGRHLILFSTDSDFLSSSFLSSFSIF
jgi:hypothetical protein